ncbi:hypothetical protein [Streptomyces sp. NPDC054834]
MLAEPVPAEPAISIHEYYGRVSWIGSDLDTAQAVETVADLLTRITLRRHGALDRPLPWHRGTVRTGAYALGVGGLGAAVVPAL